MIIDRTHAFQAPARRHVTCMKKQRAFDGAFPAAIHGNFTDRHGIFPVGAARVDTRHFTAADKGELAGLVYNTADG